MCYFIACDIYKQMNIYYVITTSLCLFIIFINVSSTSSDPTRAQSPEVHDPVLWMLMQLLTLKPIWLSPPIQLTDRRTWARFYYWKTTRKLYTRRSFGTYILAGTDAAIHVVRKNVALTRTCCWWWRRPQTPRKWIRESGLRAWPEDLKTTLLESRERTTPTQYSLEVVRGRGMTETVPLNPLKGKM